VPISAKLVASLIERAGADRVLTMELHAAQIQGFFDIPVDHLYATPAVMKYFKAKSGKLMVVSPDAGGVERARALAKRLKSPLAIIDKRRSNPGVAEVLHIIGEVEDKDCLMVDDLIDTAGTMREGADALMAAGAKSVSAFATHPVLSGPAVERIIESKFSEVVVTNSIPLREAAKDCGRIRVLTVGPLLAKAIKSIHLEDSVSKLFV
jgi:ribose-phosphate pyrophosphokinase